MDLWGGARRNLTEEVRAVTEQMRRTIPVVAVLLAAVVLAACGSAEPDEIAAIAFTSQRDGDAEIYAMSADGTGHTNLTESPRTEDSNPAFSPDGGQIAFVRDGDVWVMNADGTEQRNLTQRPESIDTDPAFSPDGEQIVFASDRDSPRELHKIYVMGADGADVVRLTGELDTGEGRRRNDSRPAFSPDGERIAFTRSGGGGYDRRDVFVMNADGTEQRNLSDSPHHDSSPAFSPDGELIAFLSSRDGGRYPVVHVMNADGGGQRSLAGSPAGDLAGRPSWSPDGRWLAFGGHPDGLGIHVVDTDGGELVRLPTRATDQDPSWSPTAAGSPPRDSRASPDGPAAEETLPITVRPEHPRPRDAIRITFPTPYAIGDVPPTVAAITERGPSGRGPGAELESRPHVRAVAGGANYHVIFNGPGGGDCEGREEFALGYVVEERRTATRTVIIERPGLRRGRTEGAFWCPGNYSGHVEFRQLIPGIPFERIGRFSFAVELSRLRRRSWFGAA